MEKKIINIKTLNCPKCGSLKTIRIGDRWDNDLPYDPVLSAKWQSPPYPMSLGLGTPRRPLAPEEASYMRYHCLECHTRFRETDERIVATVSEEELKDWIGDENYQKVKK